MRARQSTKHTGSDALGFDSLLAEHRAAWAQRWDDADIVIEGDDELQLAVRFALFHLMASVRDDGEAAVGARGLTGTGYRGHVFWDADTFMLPFLAATHPASARAMLEYRIRRLPAAVAAARAGGAPGARFPWESAGTGRGRDADVRSRSHRQASCPSAPASSRSTSSPTSPGRRAATSTGPATTTFARGPGLTAAGRDGALLGVARSRVEADGVRTSTA